MKIPSDAVIASEKLTQYLLKPRQRSDKSRFLARAGFTQENPHALESAIRQIIRENDAIFDLENEYGQFYRVDGALVGANGIKLEVVTIWMLRAMKDDVYHFVTLKPRK